MQIAKNNDCQCYITGDLGYHDAQYAQDIGLCVIDGTHYFTEVIIVPVLCEYIKNKIIIFPLDVYKRCISLSV